jgi:hypothetical protein
LPEERAKLRHRFLTQVARTLWGESASYELLMEGDAGVAMALHALLEDEMDTGKDSTVSLDLTRNESQNNP